MYQADYDLRMLAGQETVKIVFLLSGLQDEKDRYFLKLTRCRGNVAIPILQMNGGEGTIVSQIKREHGKT